MKTNNTVNSKTVELETPDLIVMNSSVTAMRSAWSAAEVAFNHAPYLPDLFASCSNWTANAVSSLATVYSSCRAIKVGLSGAITKFDSYDQALTETTDPLEHEAIYGFSEKIKTNVVVLINKEYSNLVTALGDIDKPLDTSHTKSFLTGLDTETATYVDRIEKLKQTSVTLTEERTVLTNAIEPLEKTGLIDTAQDLILTAEKVIGMGLKPPQAVLVELALEQMKKTLEDTKASLNYLSLIAARDKIRERIDANAANILEFEKSNSLVAHRVSFVNAIHDLNIKQVELATEFKKAVIASEFFLEETTDKLSEESTDSAELIVSLKRFIGYAELIR